MKYLSNSRLFPTSKHSKEWNFVIDCMLHKSQYEVTGIERIQNVIFGVNIIMSVLNYFVMDKI